METGKLVKKIHNKYPKIWERLVIYVGDNVHRFGLNDYIVPASGIIHMNQRELCNLLEGFFEEFGFIITVDITIDTQKWFYRIKQFSVGIFLHSISDYELTYKTRISAIQHGTLKACKILNKNVEVNNV